MRLVTLHVRSRLRSLLNIEIRDSRPSLSPLPSPLSPLPRHIHQSTPQSIEINFGHQIIAGGAGVIRHERRMIAGQGVEKTAFAHVRSTDQHGSHGVDRLAADDGLREDRRHTIFRVVELSVHFLTGDEDQVFVGKIETRFHVGQEIEQSVSQLVQRLGEPTGQLAKSHVQFAWVGRIDHPQHGLGLR